VIAENTTQVLISATRLTLPSQNIAAKMALPPSQQSVFLSDDDKDNNNNQQTTVTQIPKPQQWPLLDATPEPGDLFVVCRFEIPLLNYSATSDDIESFSPNPGPPAKWTFGTPDFDQEWLKIQWIGGGLEEAQTRAFTCALLWAKSDKCFWDRVSPREYRMYAGIKKLEHDLRGKVYVERPFGTEEKGKGRGEKK
jgi:hypothetical protein